MNLESVSHTTSATVSDSLQNGASQSNGMSVSTNAASGTLSEAVLSETIPSETIPSVATNSQPFTLRESVEIAMKNYFSQLEEQQPVDLYNLVLAEIEAPLMESVMKFTRGNQTRASEVLGLNRGTLRKKLKTYDLN